MANSGFHGWKDVEYYNDAGLQTIPIDFRITWAVDAVQPQQILLTFYLDEQPFAYSILSNGETKTINGTSWNGCTVSGDLQCLSGLPPYYVSYSLRFTGQQTDKGEDGTLVEWRNDATTKTGR